MKFFHFLVLSLAGFAFGCDEPSESGDDAGADDSALFEGAWATVGDEADGIVFDDQNRVFELNCENSVYVQDGNTDDRILFAYTSAKDGVFKIDESKPGEITNGLTSVTYSFEGAYLTVVVTWGEDTETVVLSEVELGAPCEEEEDDDDEDGDDDDDDDDNDDDGDYCGPVPENPELACTPEENCCGFPAPDGMVGAYVNGDFCFGVWSNGNDIVFTVECENIGAADAACRCEETTGGICAPTTDDPNLACTPEQQCCGFPESAGDSFWDNGETGCEEEYLEGYGVYGVSCENLGEDDAFCFCEYGEEEGYGDDDDDSSGPDSDADTDTD